MSEEEAREQACSAVRAQRPIKQGMHAHAGSSEELWRLPADFNEAGATLSMTTSVNPSISPDPATSRSVSPTTAARPASANMVGCSYIGEVCARLEHKEPAVDQSVVHVYHTATEVLLQTYQLHSSPNLTRLNLIHVKTNHTLLSLWMLGLTSIVHVHIVRLPRFPSAGFLAEASTVSSTGHHLRDKVV